MSLVTKGKRVRTLFRVRTLRLYCNSRDAATAVRRLFPLCELLGLPPRVVRFLREPLKQLHESVGLPALRRMADEQPVV